MSSLPERVRRALIEIVGSENVRTDPTDCWVYGYDNSRRHRVPRAVAFVVAREQVQRLVALCRAEHLPITARGMGTGTTGASVPAPDGLVIAFERMDRILAIDPANRLARVEPGVINETLQKAVAAHGFFWPPDPTSAAVCTIGGNLACNAAGPRAVKYGTARENTLALVAVTGSGALLRTGTQTSKGVVGYDLTRLVIGSEGTLALIVEATLKLTPLSAAKRTLRASYRDIHAAAAAVAAIMAQSVTPCALEFMDATAIALARGVAELTLAPDTGALLTIEVDGPLVGIDEAAAAVAQAARVPGVIEVEVAADPAEIAALWQARRALSPALRQAAPGKINEDVTVPVSQIGTLVEHLEQVARTAGIRIVNFGHAGNGNIHVNLLYDPADAAETRRAHHALAAVFEAVLALGGTLSGEHGVGLSKRDFVARELDPTAVALMHALKRQFDPDNILNPGKSLPTAAVDC